MPSKVRDIYNIFNSNLKNNKVEIYYIYIKSFNKLR